MSLLLIAALGICGFTSCTRSTGMKPVRLDSSGTMYHATFEQLGKALKEPKLDDGKPAQVSFFLGTVNDPRAKNSYRADIDEKFLEQLKAKGDSELTVVMTCQVCKGEPLAARRIKFSSTRGVSDTATFDVMPDHASTDSGSPTGAGKIAFSIMLNGSYVDNFVVPVVVVRAGSALSAVSGGAMQAPSREQFDKLAQIEQRPADLEIIVTGTGNEYLKLQFIGESALFREAFHKENLSAEDLEAGFKTALSEDDLSAMQKDYYCRVAQLLTTDESARAQLLQNCTDVGGHLELPDYRFSSGESQRFLSVLHEQGFGLYRKLFRLTAPTDPLARTAKVIESVASQSRRPLRIQINTRGIYIPWPILAANPASVSFKEFWGIQYELSVLHTGSDAPVPITLQGPLDEPNVIFATHQDADVAGQARQISDAFFTTSPHAKNIPEPLHPLSSSADFLKALQAKASTLKLVVVHSHGSVATLEASEKIFFAKNDFIQPIQLNTKVGLWQAASPPLFASRPMVLLNACETGASGYSKRSNMSFVGVFNDYGASAVIVTDAKVPQMSATHFARNLLQAVSNGIPIAEAVRRTRESLWRDLPNPEHDNFDPTGLLYSYYGTPGLVLEKAGSMPRPNS